MSRAVQVGGRQGRGDPAMSARRLECVGPFVVRVRPKPDALAYTVAQNIRETTPGVRLDQRNPYTGDFIAWRLFTFAMRRRLGVRA